MSTAIHMEGLTKEFGRLRAVDGLTVDVQTGGVVGLLGPNGAGKSTTIRMLLGLIRPTAGSATVLGKSIERPAAYIEEVGALIESPAFYPKLSGETNLGTLAALDGQSKNRIDEVLEIVGLRDRRGDRVAEYSSGMKQRLGIAAALLRDPSILILDEPANGLDPAGIVEMRELLRDLGSSGKTVFVSSHLLAEVQAMVDEVIIISNGRLVFDGALTGLLAEAAHEVVVAPEEAQDLTELAAALSRAGYAATIDDGVVRVAGAAEAPARLNRLAFDHGIALRELWVHDEDLEDIFLRMTDGEMGL
ncbi:MAG: ABC transporter ATP-binding protein [Acidimicrobiia bacterium]